MEIIGGLVVETGYVPTKGKKAEKKRRTNENHVLSITKEKEATNKPPTNDIHVVTTTKGNEAAKKPPTNDTHAVTTTKGKKATKKLHTNDIPHVTMANTATLPTSIENVIIRYIKEEQVEITEENRYNI
ncbi:hypothetical protein RYX36_006634 [Vicia faba]